MRLTTLLLQHKTRYDETRENRRCRMCFNCCRALSMRPRHAPARAAAMIKVSSARASRSAQFRMRDLAASKSSKMESRQDFPLSTASLSFVDKFSIPRDTHTPAHTHQREQTHRRSAKPIANASAVTYPTANNASSETPVDPEWIILVTARRVDVP